MLKGFLDEDNSYMIWKDRLIEFDRKKIEL